jgi:hypothetical protein
MTQPDAAMAIVGLVRLRLRARLAWLAYRAESLESAFDTVEAALDDGDEPDAEQRWAMGPELSALRTELAAVQGALAGCTRWQQLCTRLGLTGLDADVVLVAVAAALEPGLKRVFASLRGAHGRLAPSVAIVARAFGHGRRTLSPGSPALRWRLIELAGDEEPNLVADPAIVAWLIDGELQDEPLRGVGTVVEQKPPLAGWPLAQGRAWLARRTSGPRALRVVGTPGSGRRTFAAALAHDAPCSLFAVDETRAPADSLQASRQRWLLACRRARLLDQGLAWIGPMPLGADAEAMPALLFWIVDPLDAPATRALRLDPSIELPLPDVTTRLALWQRLLPTAATWPREQLEYLAAAHRVTVGEVQAVASLGVNDALSAGQAVREAGRGAMGGLAQRLVASFELDDLIVSPSVRGALEDLVFEARERLLVWEDANLRRLFPLGTGLLALFSGSPGTGKTMAAQVLARQLGLDLHRIDLAATVSKYVGETARNIDRVLATAARMDVVLFFDEADSLFGKRTEIRDAHDRYANTDTNYLLQAIESYPGIAILATNRKGNIDQAFLRRIRHAIDFPAPDSTLRLRLWGQLVSDIGGSQAHGSAHAALPTLATSFDLSGAQIKYIVLHSLYLARREGAQIRARHLMSGVERELNKEGRGLGRAERDRLLAFEHGASA